LQIALTGWKVVVDKLNRGEKAQGKREVFNMVNILKVDQLTGLYNRNEMMSRIAKMVHEKKLFSVALLDVDLFKAFNDEKGHAMGDEYLRTLARIIKKNTRDIDFVARYGGEEFVLLLPGLSSEETLFMVEDIRRYIVANPFELTASGETATIALTVSGGIACCPKDGKEVTGLLRKADNALFRAKAGGRNRILISMDEKMTLKSNYYTKSQLTKLQELAGETEKTEAFLLREALDDLLKKYKFFRRDREELHRWIKERNLGVGLFLLRALEEKGVLTAGHSERVAGLAERFAEALELPVDEREAVKMAALLHDAGKLGIPDDLLKKKGSCSPEELKAIQRHVAICYDLLHTLGLERAAELVYSHHEKYDGTGYPRGLAGEDIPVGARIIAIADFFDTVTEVLGSMTPEKALDELSNRAFEIYGQDLVETFRKMMDA